MLMSLMLIYQTIHLPQTILIRLKGKKHIEQLFSEGKKISHHPLTLVVMVSKTSSYGVSVGKRHFKLAVNRNKIKRLLREVTKKFLEPVLDEKKEHYSVMLLYTSKKMPTIDSLEKEASKLAEKITQVL